MAYEKRVYTEGVEEITYEDMNRMETGIEANDLAIAQINSDNIERDKTIANKVEKEEGKGLSENDYTSAEKNKLAGVDEGANKYTHPNNHQASMIVQSAERRFVSDTEKATWNAKETTEGAQEKADAALESAKEYANEKIKLNGAQADVNFTAEGEKLTSVELGGKKYNFPTSEYAFSIDQDGMLVVTYRDNTVPPDFSIDEDGCLTLTI